MAQLKKKTDSTNQSKEKIENLNRLSGAKAKGGRVSLPVKKTAQGLRASASLDKVQGTMEHHLIETTMVNLHAQECAAQSGVRRFPQASASGKPALKVIGGKNEQAN